MLKKKWNKEKVNYRRSWPTKDGYKRRGSTVTNRFLLSEEERGLKK